MKKCKKCGAPLEGWLYKTIGKLMGIKPSAKDPEVCNKCENDAASPVVAPEKPAAPAATPIAPIAPQPEAEKKDEVQI